MPLFPYHISAESVGGSSPIIGVNITYIGYDGEVVPYQTTVRFDTEQTMWRCTSSHSTMGCQVWESENISGSTLDEITGTITTNATSTYTYRLYQYEFIFDKTYVGSITFNGNHPGATTTTTYYVNGDRLVLTDINLVTSFTIGSYNLTYAPLETITKLRQWDIPIESLNWNVFAFNNNFQLKYLDNFNYLNYPMFTVDANTELYRFWGTTSGNRQSYTFIVLISDNVDTINTVSNNFSVKKYSDGSSDGTFSDYYQLSQFSNGNKIYSIIKFTVSGFTANGFKSLYYNSQQDFIFIYSNTSNYKTISTDFALRYNLSNSLIDNINTIAQGTSASNSSSNDLEDSADDIVQNSSTMFQFENQQNTNMNNALQSINTSFDIGNIGSSFLTSAAWVKTQFDNLTNTTPFGSVLSFSLLLGLSLLIIGKVYK